MFYDWNDIRRMNESRRVTVTAVFHAERIIWTENGPVYVQGPNDPPILELKFEEQQGRV